jgi:hypothetical protein
MNAHKTLTWLQYAFANVVIIVLVPCLVVDGLPPVMDWVWYGVKSAMKPKTPQRAAAEEMAAEAEETEEEDRSLGPTYYVRSWTDPLMNFLATWTDEWIMFAPSPDTSNHRVRAEIEYVDGTRVDWHSPDWPQLSCWRRFWSSRELEYMDVIAYDGSVTADHWSAFADYLARRHRQNPAAEGAPRKVKFIVEEARIEDPREFGWVPMSQFLPRDIEGVRSIRKYSLPKKGSGAVTPSQTSSTQP